MLTLICKCTCRKAVASSDAQLLAAVAAQPTLLQRPILVKGERAVVGRPVQVLGALL